MAVKCLIVTRASIIIEQYHIKGISGGYSVQPLLQKGQTSTSDQTAQEITSPEELFQNLIILIVKVFLQEFPLLLLLTAASSRCKREG